MAWHFRSGYALFVLVIFRLFWGLVGGRWSRFSSFMYSPRAFVRYLRSERRVGDDFEVGHSPLGALSVFALLTILGLQVASGLVADDTITNSGPWAKFVSESASWNATHWHRGAGQWLILGLVALHFAAVSFYVLQRRQPLLRAMITGDKPADADVSPSTDSVISRSLALALLLLCIGGVAWLVTL